ncbi:MAG TPA: aldo/keto reductase [Hyphomicrobium sp.]
MRERMLSRRTVLSVLGAVGGACLWPGAASGASRAPVMTRTIPASGEQVAAVGMGTWITFNVGDDPALRNERVKVLQAFFDMGGTLIDSSPMYGSSEEVIGYCLAHVTRAPPPFAATKVWTLLKMLGEHQIERSRKLWGLDRFDLMQVHNLLNWESHLATLREEKVQGRLRYIGITTSHGRRHDEFEDVMRTEPLDFVQFTYNILDREAEKRLLPLAADRGLGVIINRPFAGGGLFDRFARHPLPAWAREIDCADWAPFFLKFIISHPAVTCAIPATSRVDHMQENMGALHGRLPDQEMRARMIQYVESL